MDKKERFIKAYNYLRSQGIISTQQELAEAMKAARPNVSLALKGEPRVLTDKFITRFYYAFPDTFNLSWLMEGKGTMLLESSETVTAPIDKQQDALTYAALQIGRLTAQLEETLRRVEKKEEELTARLKRLDDLQRRIEGVTSFDMVSEHPKKIAEP